MHAVVIGAVDAEIVALEERMRAAQLNGDLGALNELIDEDLLFTGPGGQLASKAQDLDAYRSATVRFRSHEPEELRVRRVGQDVAISALRARLEVNVAGTITRGTYRYTRVWVRDTRGAWRVVAGHVSEVMPGESPRDRG